MSAIPTGSDGRALVTTVQAAYSLGWTPGRFRTWAYRRHLTPASYRTNPSRGQRIALWDLADITHALGVKGRAA